MKTYIKWVGNKYKYKNKIFSLFPETFNNYYEPFLGSASIFFNIYESDKKQNIERQYFLVDNNNFLINAHLVLRDFYDQLLEELGTFEKNDSLEFYNEQRKEILEIENIGKDIKAAARFIYFNRRAYGGMWRMNSKGFFNVPMDKSQKKSLFSKEFGICSEVLKKANISYGDYQSLLPKEGDFVFLDPPYYPLSKTSNFSSYTNVWKQEDHILLIDYIKDLNKNNIKFMLCNNDCDFIRDNLAEFTFNLIDRKVYIDALNYELKDGTNKVKNHRQTVRDVIVTNY